jgi:glucose-6-phosphate 1-dehydrogenase
MTANRAEPTLFVIFGGTGDLARRKLLPALARLAGAGLLAPPFHLLAVARDTRLDDEAYRRLAAEALDRAQCTRRDVEALDLKRLHYQPVPDGDPAAFGRLAARVQELEARFGLPGNRLFNLALPPQAVPAAVQGLGAASLARGPGWTRVVIEKPFGHDYDSARALNELLHSEFEERQIYRIDHYLGKETVQNLLVFRLANGFIESLWNRGHIHSVYITVAESLGVGSRAGYYDRSGALRDMVQNHLTQLLMLVAMEAPSAFEAEAVRYEKIKVLRSIPPIECRNVVLGQYRAGEVAGRAVPGYRQEPGVAPDSNTETFVALKLLINSWRWQGVPFYLRTGKRLPRRLTQIAVRFQASPVCLFESLGGGCMETSDVLLITLQPNEGFSLHLDIKTPGSPLRLRRIPLSFNYRELFPQLPEAYETLLHDVLLGDQTLFVHADEVEASWRLFTPLLRDRPPVFPYAAGTWGPPEAEWLELPERELWEA